MSDDDRGRGAGDAGHAVMLGQPEALVAELLGVARQIQRVAKGLGGVAAFEDWREVKDRQWLHGPMLINHAPAASPYCWANSRLGGICRITSMSTPFGSDVMKWR